MQTNLKIKYRIDQNQQESQGPYINILPNHPQQAYRQIHKQSDNLVTAIRQTERIPFSMIRQLILMYTIDNLKIVDLPESDLLLQKKRQNKQVEKVEKVLNQICDYWLKEKGRLQKLKMVTVKYKENRKEPVSKENASNKNEERDFSNELNQKFNYIKIQRSDARSKDVIRPEWNVLGDNQKKKKIADYKIEQQKKISAQLQSIMSSKLLELNARKIILQDRIKNMREFGFFVIQYEKSLIIVLASRKVKLDQLIKEKGEDVLLKFENNLEEILKQINTELNYFMQSLFRWRMLKKHHTLIHEQKKGGKQKQRQFESEDELYMNQFQIRNQKISTNVMEKVYRHINKVMKLVEEDREEVKKNQNITIKEYQKFLSIYYRAKEVATYSQNQVFLVDKIKNEIRLLTNHLRNCQGLVGPYEMSQQFKNYYESLNLNRKDKKQSDIKILVEENMNYLHKLMKFVNQDYVKIFSLISNRRLNDAKNQIKLIKEDFTKDLPFEQQQIMQKDMGLFQSKLQKVDESLLFVFQNLRRLMIFCYQ